MQSILYKGGVGWSSNCILPESFVLHCVLQRGVSEHFAPCSVKVDKSYSVSQSKRRNEEDFQGQNFKGNYILSLINTESFFRLVGWERGSNLKSFWGDPLFCFKHFKWIYSYIRLFQCLKKFLNFSLPAKDNLHWTIPCTGPLHPCSPFITKALFTCNRIFLKKRFFPFSKKIRVHAWRIWIVFARPLENAKTMEIRQHRTEHAQC